MTIIRTNEKRETMKFTDEQNKRVALVRTSLSEHLPKGLPLLKLCRSCMSAKPSASASHLLFFVFARLCQKEATKAPLPDRAFVFVLQSIFPKRSVDFFTALVERFHRSYDSFSSDAFKLKVLFLCTIGHGFREELAIAKKRMEDSSALDGISGLFRRYHDNKIQGSSSVKDLISLRSVSAQQIFEEVIADVSEEACLTPLSSYPMM